MFESIEWDKISATHKTWKQWTGTNSEESFSFQKPVFRVSEKEYLQDFQKYGRLRFGSLESYRNTENDNEVGDKAEGVGGRFTGNTSKLYINGKPIKIKEMHLHNADHFVSCTYISSFSCGGTPQNFSQCSCCGIQYPPTSFIDGRYERFGATRGYEPWVIFIVDENAFFNRLFRVVEASPLGLSIAIGPVTYYDNDDFSGTITPFMKRSSYAHQRELRIAIFADPNSGPIFLELGALDGIVTEPIKLDSFYRDNAPFLIDYRRGPSSL